MIKAGYDVAEIAFFGLEGYKTMIPIDDEEILVYPKVSDPYGSDALVLHGKDYDADVVFTMQDIWTLQPQFLNQVERWIPYLPIDQEPVAPMILERLGHAYKIITFSKFGQRALEKHGFASTFIPEGVDTTIFKPKDRDKMRLKYGIPGSIFLFGMISANKENPPRKGYQEILEALKMFVEKHPEAGLFIHSQQTSPHAFPLVAYAKHLGIDKHLYGMNQYMATFKSDSEAVSDEINMFDVTMNASQTEGFGLVIVESQACGVPVIVNNCHSMPELVVDGKTGAISDTGYAWWRNQNGYVHAADPNSLYEKMEEMYKLVKEKPEETKKACRQNVLKNYNIDDIFKNKWIPFLDELESEIE